MNIFFLHWLPVLCAQYQVNSHVNKMVTETAQLLCTALGNQSPYAMTHFNHPCAVWARKSKANWKWLRRLGLELYREWRIRFNHGPSDKHKAGEVILAMKCPDLPDGVFTIPPACVADDCRPVRETRDSVIRAYREYYILHKRKLHNWGNRGPPEWLNDYEIYTTPTGAEMLIEL